MAHPEIAHLGARKAHAVWRGIKVGSTCLVVLTSSTIWTAAASAAEQICVSCQDPAAIYRCSIQQADRIKQVRKADRLMHLSCIKDIAQRYGHTSCAVNNVQSRTCEGVIHVVRAEDAARHVLANRGKLGGTTQQRLEPPPTAQPPGKGEPKTVVELQTHGKIHKGRFAEGRQVGFQGRRENLEVSQYALLWLLNWRILFRQPFPGQFLCPRYFSS